MKFRVLVPLGFAAAVYLLMPFAQQPLAALSELRKPAATECYGRGDATLQFVYLHGLDTYGPSWRELSNRHVIRALADEFDARVALPRRRGAWPQGDAAVVAQTRKLIDDAAATCFNSGAYGIVGFSNGGNAANELYLQCEPAKAAWIISAGSEATLARDRRTSFASCGRLVLVAGRHEVTYPIARGFSRQLEKRGADVHFIEHDGSHELPYPAAAEALARALR